ncbi:MAG: alpha/beta hydrolase [Gemmataceae bacterium]
MPNLLPLPERIRPKAYGRRQPLILLNGLAEQAESWFKNRRYWSRFFEVYAPNILAYDGAALHDRIETGEPISVDYLVEQLHLYLKQFVQSPPYHLVASSLGGKIAVEFAVKYPDLVNRIVLLCPSGMGDKEQLPVMEGVRRSDWNSVIRTVFHRPHFVDRDMVRFYKTAIQNRRWKMGFLRTIRGTIEHSVREKLKLITCPTLFVTGENDCVCDPAVAAQAAMELPNGHFREIPACGHAPQIEKHWLVNRLVVHFLGAQSPSANPGWTKLFLAKPTRVIL